MLTRSSGISLSSGLGLRGGRLCVCSAFSHCSRSASLLFHRIAQFFTFPSDCILVSTCSTGEEACDTNHPKLSGCENCVGRGSSFPLQI
jgi:hypothetical protein